MKNKNYSVINMETWPRKLHCAIFRDSLMPQYCVSFDLNITHFYREIKRRGLSFSMAFMYETAKCGNKIENFRYRFENGEVVLYDQIGTSFTYMEKGAELFKMIKVDMKDTLEEYIETAQTIIKNNQHILMRLRATTCSFFGNSMDILPLYFPYIWRKQGKRIPGI